MAMGTGRDNAAANGEDSNQRIAPATCSDTKLRLVLQNDDQGWSGRQSVCTPIVTLCGFVLGASCNVHRPGTTATRNRNVNHTITVVSIHTSIGSGIASRGFALVLTIPCIVHPSGLVQGFLNHRKSRHCEEYAIRVRLPACDQSQPNNSLNSRSVVVLR